MHKRTRARRLVMQALYQADVLGEEFLDDTRSHLQSVSKHSQFCDFIQQLFETAISNEKAIDETLEGVARNWHISRMAAVDRALLRMALAEMLFLKETPPKVIINEAVELAKRYSTAASGSFVNGILDHIHKDGVSL